MGLLVARGRPAERGRLRPGDVDAIEAPWRRRPRRWWRLSEPLVRGAPQPGGGRARRLRSRRRVHGHAHAGQRAAGRPGAPADGAVAPPRPGGARHRQRRPVAGLGGARPTGDPVVQAMLGMVGVLRSGLRNPRYAYLPINRFELPGALLFAEACRRASRPGPRCRNADAGTISATCSTTARPACWGCSAMRSTARPAPSPLPPRIGRPRRRARRRRPSGRADPRGRARGAPRDRPPRRARAQPAGHRRRDPGQGGLGARAPRAGDRRHLRVGQRGADPPRRAHARLPRPRDHPRAGRRLAPRQPGDLLPQAPGRDPAAVRPRRRPGARRRACARPDA